VEVVFSGRRLQDASLEVTYEIAVADEAELNATESVVAEIETLRDDLVAALISEVNSSLAIEGLVVSVVSDVVVDLPYTPSEPSYTSDSGEPTSFALVAGIVVVLLLVAGGVAYAMKLPCVTGSPEAPAAPAP